MPPKQSITKEMVANAAFQLVKTKGRQALSARNISKELSCSTQPIYSCFANMNDLENAVLKLAFEYITMTYLTGNIYSEEPFFSMGLGYIQVAKKDPHIFDLIYLSEYTEQLFGNEIYPVQKENLILSMKKDSRLNSLDDEALLDILSHMWIYSHGLAMLARANPKLDDRLIHEKLHEMGRTMIVSKLKEKGAIPHEFYCD